MTPDKIILVIALAIVAGILGWGVMTMARGGDYNVKNSNRIMRYRIIFQAAALIVILGLIWWRRSTG
jgi:H+/Cl- antiporter ClcA